MTVDTPNVRTLGVFYAENIAGGANTITVNEGINGNTLRFAILEYSGVALTNSLDVTAAAQGVSSTASSCNSGPRPGRRSATRRDHHFRSGCVHSRNQLRNKGRHPGSVKRQARHRGPDTVDSWNRLRRGPL